MFSVLVALALASEPIKTQQETCVPAVDGGWHCGASVTTADAAPLPQANRPRSRPPVLLIDPRRFDSLNAGATLPVSAQMPEASQNSQVATKGMTEAESAPPAAYTIQLVRASSNRGFSTYLSRVGIAKSKTREVLLANGEIVLLYGQFASMSEARSAIPNAASGAFVRKNDF